MKLKVCLVGERAVGKTSLVRRFVMDEFDDRYIRTLGTKVSKKNVKVVRSDQDKEYHINMTIWDIMGEKSFTDLLQEAFFFGANGVIAVCDLTRKRTLKELKGWVEQVYGVTGEIPVAILGNKSDLRSRKQLTKKDIVKLSKEYKSDSYLTSAKTGYAVEKAFQSLAEAMVEQRTT
ncbi:MAG: GTP-binding protein [Methanobacteriota archaeon]|nr:MAG: GTP-binding protein [Euryarchaeota archaeon]